LFRPNEEKVKEIQRRAAKAGAEFVPILQRHIGTDKSPVVIEEMTNYVERKGIKISELTEVYTISKKGNIFNLKTNKGELEAKIVLAAPGRSGAKWFYDQAKKLGVDMISGPLDIGVRVEVESFITEDTDLRCVGSQDNNVFEEV